MKRHLQPLEVKKHEKKTHVWKLKKALYDLRRHPWDNIYMRILNIAQSDEDLKLCHKVEYESLQRMKSSQMGVRRNFEKVQYRGSWYLVTLDIKGSYLSLQYIMFECIEYERKKNNDALLQRESLQNILRFDMVWQDWKLTNGSRIYSE